MFHGTHILSAILFCVPWNSVNQQIIQMIRPVNEKILNVYGVKRVPKCLYLFDIWSCEVFLRLKSSKDGKQPSVKLSFMGHKTKWPILLKFCNGWDTVLYLVFWLAKKRESPLKSHMFLVHPLGMHFSGNSNTAVKVEARMARF